MPQDYDLLGGDNTGDIRSDRSEELSLDNSSCDTIAHVDEILRNLCNRVLWEVIWHILDPDGKLSNHVLSQVIRTCRDAMQSTAEDEIISDDPEVIQYVKDKLDLDIQEGVRFFLSAYRNSITSKQFRDSIVEDLSKRIAANVKTST